MIEDLFKPEILLILFVIIFFLFGAQRLPGLGKSLGHGIHEFRSGIAGLSDDEPDALEQPAETPAVTAAVDTPVEAATATPAPAHTDAAATADDGLPPAATTPVDEVVDPGDVTIVDEPVDVTPIEADEATIVDDEAVASVTDDRAAS